MVLRIVKCLPITMESLISRFFRVRSRVPYRSWEINFFESFVKQNVGVSRVVSEVLLE